MLKFSPGSDNVKLAKLQTLTGKRVYSFSLLSGYTCPGAHDCRSFAIEKDGKRTIMDGPHTKFRCFSASQEALYTNVYHQRKQNFVDLSSMRHDEGAMTLYVGASLPKRAEIVRVHVAGDFFSSEYFRAWMNVAKSRPDILFYAYTKSLRYWMENKDKVPHNFMLTASKGGRYDNLITEHKLRYAVVVPYSEDAKKLRLQVDTDDSHAALPEHKRRSFALVVHGTQPAGTVYAKSVARQRHGEIV